MLECMSDYYIGHSSVRTCQRIMANVQLFGNIRHAYSAKEAFDVHPTKRHTEQSPFPDQLKGLWFCLREGMFEYVEGRKEAISFPKEDGKASIPKSKVSIVEKGVAKVKANFSRKLHDCFPSVRKVSLDNVMENNQEDTV